MLCNKNKNKTIINELKIDNNTISNKTEIANKFVKHYTELGENYANKINIPKNYIENKNILENSMGLFQVGIQEIIGVIKNLKQKSHLVMMVYDRKR